MYDARAIMVSHNHPEEIVFPSSDDMEITKSISQAAATVCIKLLDHITVAGEQYYSFMEKGMMPEKGIDFTKVRINRNDFAVEEDEEIEI